MEIINYLESRIVAGSSVLDWIIAMCLSLLVASVALGLRRFAVWRAQNTPASGGMRWVAYFLGSLSRTKMLVILIVSVWAGAQCLDLSEKAHALVSRATILAMFFQAGIWIDGYYRAWYANYYEIQRSINPATVTALGALRVVVSAVIWICVILLALDNIGVNVMTLLTGLGIGGIALALAVQSTLGDLLASLSIVLDKPFVVGDFLIVDEHMGTVENIGLKTTRIRSLSGEQLVFSNTNLLQSRIRNYGRMYERRVVVQFGVTYQTDIDLLDEIPRMVRAAIEAQDKTRFDRAHFKAHGDSSLDYEYVYFVASPDFNLYMDIQQAISLTLHRQFAEKGIEFAYPTRTIFIEKLPARPDTSALSLDDKDDKAIAAAV